MSVSIILVPLAFAAIAAAKASSEGQSDTISCRVNTRMRDPELLRLALSDLDAQVHASSSNSIEFELESGNAAMTRDDAGIWSAVFSQGLAVEEAMETVMRIDSAYGLRVQAEVLKRIRERAPETGLRVVSESTNSDSSVVLMLSLQEA